MPYTPAMNVSGMKMVAISVSTLHDLVHPVRKAGEVDINHPGQHVPEDLQRVDNLYGMVIDIPEVNFCGILNER
jgi:hypothetical protein